MIIYCAKNKVNGKCYIGKTVKSLETRKRNHKGGARLILKNGGPSLFHTAINECGFNNFEWSILEICKDDKALDLAERKWIKKMKTFENGYNLTYGGGSFGTTFTQERRDKISKKAKKRIRTKKGSLHLKKITKLALKAITGKSRSDKFKKDHSDFMRKTTDSQVRHMFKLRKLGLNYSQISRKTGYCTSRMVALILKGETFYTKDIGKFFS